MIKNISLIAFLLISISLSAQETIEEQFQDFYKNNTSTWQEFKLIKKPKLKEFWSVVSDTLSGQKQEVKTLRSKITELDAKIESLKSQLATTQLALKESIETNESIGFFGMMIAKSSYNLIVWSIILILTLGIVAIYFLYLRSNKVTIESQSLLVEVEEELRLHKEKAREQQMKLKRELQTALNTIHENRMNH